MKLLFVNLSYLFMLLGEFFRDMKSQKKRTMLTLFGIVWGTAAVVLMMAVGTSTRRQNIKNFKGLGDNIILVFPGTTTKPYRGFGVDRDIRLERSDVELLKTRIPQIERISEEFSTWRSWVRVGKKTRTPLVAGVAPSYWKMRNVIPQRGGRFINERDQREKRRVVFLGNELKDFLFGEESPAVGRFVNINNIPFRVIGVLRKKVQNSSYNSRDKDRAYIPSETFQTMFGHRHLNDMIIQHGEEAANSHQIVQGIREVLGDKYIFDSADEDALHIWDTAEFFNEFMMFFTGFNIFLLVMGAATLCVGGLGVSNIMYVVVRERTREIGIKRAVGAKSWVIQSQFFAETFLITIIGASIGFTIAWGIISLLANMPEAVKNSIGIPTIDPLVAVVSGLIILFVGLIAGYFPARKASRLDPVDCLNY
ncbi:MAG: ABC transporter permease [Candidatus Krumholzibacteriota bacterium]|nr:ABC transporter permease [Candidatus Krumholzibacteriota bacterium]